MTKPKLKRPDNFIDALKEDLRLQGLEIVKKGALKAQFDAGVEFGIKTTSARIIHDKGYEKGFAEAVEKAADLADDHNGCIRKECMTSSNCAVQTANDIRGLRPGGEGEP